MKKQKNTLYTSVRFFCITLTVLLISILGIWGFQNNWGQVKVRRLNLMGDNGTKISTLAFIPENASSEHPAPGVLICHGRSNQGHSNDTWSMELARRGYVVLSPDLSGGGESDVNDREIQAVNVARYMNTMDIVQQDALTLVGYSAGCKTVNTVYHAMPDSIDTIVDVFGPFMLSISGFDESFFSSQNANVVIIKATADQYDYNFIGGPQECRVKTAEMFGLGNAVEPDRDYDLNGHLFRYTEVSGALHQTGNISSETISAIIDFIGKIKEAPVQRAVTDQAWLPQQICSGIAAVDMMFLLAAFIGMMLEMPFFRPAANIRPQRTPQKGAKAWVLDILFSFVIPAVLFIPVSAYGMAWFAQSKIFTSTNLNGIMLWLLAIGLIGVIRMLIKARFRKKNGEMIQPSDYCLAAEGEKISPAAIAKAFLIGITGVCFFGLMMTAFEVYFGVDIQIWNLATYLKPSGTRILRAIPYMLIIFTVMFLGNMNQRTLPFTGNERKDMVIAVTVNTIMTAFALFFLLVLQYGGSLIIGTGKPVFEQMVIPGIKGGTSVGALDFAFGYCYMMGGTTGVVTYLYRKYGNIWIGTIPCAIFCGLFTTLGFTLVV